MRTLTTSICAIFLLSGCSFFENVFNSPESTAALIRSTARLSTIAGLETGVKNDEERVAIAKEINRVCEMASDVITSGINLDAQSLDILLNETLGPLYEEYPLLATELKDAANLVISSIEFPEPGELLDDEGKMYLLALFDGVSSGCVIVLNRYDEVPLEPVPDSASVILFLFHKEGKNEL